MNSHVQPDSCRQSRRCHEANLKGEKSAMYLLNHMGSIWEQVVMSLCSLGAKCAVKCKQTVAYHLDAEVMQQSIHPDNLTYPHQWRILYPSSDSAKMSQDTTGLLISKSSTIADLDHQQLHFCNANLWHAYAYHYIVSPTLILYSTNSALTQLLFMVQAIYWALHCAHSAFLGCTWTSLWAGPILSSAIDVITNAFINPWCAQQTRILRCLSANLSFHNIPKTTWQTNCISLHLQVKLLLQQQLLHIQGNTP